MNEIWRRSRISIFIMFFYSIALYDGGPKVWKDCGGVDLVGEGYLKFYLFCET